MNGKYKCPHCKEGDLVNCDYMGHPEAFVCDGCSNFFRLGPLPRGYDPVFEMINEPRPPLKEGEQYGTYWHGDGRFEGALTTFVWHNGTT